MVSNLSVCIFLIALITLVGFFVWSRRTHKKRELLNSLFAFLSIAYSSWVIPLIIMRFVDVNNIELMFFLDCLMQPGGALCAPIYLCIAISFVEGYEKMRKWMKWLFLLPFLYHYNDRRQNLTHAYYRQSPAT